MASSTSRPASGASSSILDLKAMVAQRRATGKREDKQERRYSSTKSDIWSRPNKGIAQRAAQDDASWAKLHSRSAESVESRLKKKAEIYDKLSRGKTGGLTEKQLDNLLIDFDSKEAEEDSSEYSEPEMDSTQEEPLVEITDEFGRTRQVKRSEVSRETLYRSEPAFDTNDGSTVLRGPHISNFPIYEPSAERVAKIMEDAKEDPITKHYDATNENRAKGAGFYQFAADEETRQQQMENLMRLRGETKDIREEIGATDNLVDIPTATLDRAANKRKRDLEDRRAKLNAKRRKGNDESQGAKQDAMDFLSKIADELGG